MRKILSTDSNVSYFHSAYKGELGFTALATLLPTPPTPPPQKKKKQKEKAVVCPNQTEAESLSWFVDCQQSFGYFYCICL